MKPISQTFLFEITDKIINYGENAKNMESEINHLDLKDLAYFIDLIDRRFNFAMKSSVLADLKNGFIIPVFNKKNIGLPTYIPCMGTFKGRDAVIFANLTHYGFLNKSKSFEIDTKKLFSILQTSYLLRQLVTIPWKKVSLNLTIMKAGSYIYSLMFSKLLDKMFALNIDPIQFDSARYLASKFFLINVLDKGSEGMNVIDGISMNNTLGYLTKNTVTNFNFDNMDNFVNLDVFLQSLNNINNIRNLNTRIFLQEWIKMYGEGSLMALEYFPFFLHTVFSTYLSANMVNDFIIDPLVGKDISSLYTEMTKILR